jgi:pimeloyl-ACP methyl ester carboxylesterase
MPKEAVMHVDLVQTTTADGLRLDGSLQLPARPQAGKLGVDAVCLVHGTGGNFYGSTLFDSCAERFLELGCAVLRINTRGHDGISVASTAAGGQRLGAAYELVDDCRRDLAAWADWLRQRTGPRLALVGHSLGAVKCLYALAHESSLAVDGVIAVSPPRLSYAWFCGSPEGPQFLADFHLAEQHVENGRPLTLIDVKQPLPLAIAAAGYVEKYGPDERYNYLRFLPGVRCPTLITLGSIEVQNSMAFRDAPEALAEVRHSRLTVEAIAGADHFYSGVQAELLARVEAWLRSALPAGQRP